ncbi:unnamed protein product [Amoebophrya sp. A120]|nr:unnamed protein product [Amoebophrya sp. A120]|eukprot:GSA120T00009431001.1
MAIIMSTAAPAAPTDDVKEGGIMVKGPAESQLAAFVVPPSYNASSEELEKVEEMRKLLGAKQLRSLPGGATGEMCVRFLRARAGNVEKATDMLEKHLDWVAKWRPLEIRQSEIDVPLQAGSMCMFGVNKYGNPVMYGASRAWNPHQYSLETCIKFMSYYLAHTERLCERTDANQFVLVFDVSYWALWHGKYLSYSTQLMKILQDQFPERLRQAFVINAPALFQGFFRLCKSMIDKKTVDKIKFLSIPKGTNFAADMKTSTSSTADKSSSSSSKTTSVPTSSPSSTASTKATSGSTPSPPAIAATTIGLSNSMDSTPDNTPTTGTDVASAAKGAATSSGTTTASSGTSTSTKTTENKIPSPEELPPARYFRDLTKVADFSKLEFHPKPRTQPNTPTATPKVAGDKGSKGQQQTNSTSSTAASGAAFANSNTSTPASGMSAKFAQFLDLVPMEILPVYYVSNANSYVLGSWNNSSMLVMLNAAGLKCDKVIFLVRFVLARGALDKPRLFVGVGCRTSEHDKRAALLLLRQYIFLGIMRNISRVQHICNS